MKKLSVIVPVYNVEEYLEKCLDSLVNQTLKDIEIIVVNDESPDNSQLIIDKYKKNYPDKIISIKQKNTGQGVARNNALKKASGEYITYVDSDDWIDLDAYAHLYKVAKKKDADIVIFGNKVVSMEGNIISEDFPVIYDDKKFNILFGKLCVWNKIYKREIIQKSKVEFLPKLWYEDVNFSMRIMFENYKTEIVNECYYNYLLRPGSTMNNSNVMRNLEIIDIFKHTIKSLKDSEKYDSNYDEIEYLAVFNAYLCAIIRVINCQADKKVKLEVINELKKFTFTEFPNFSKNIFLKKLTFNRKCLMILIKLNLYNFISLLFKIKNQ